MQRPQVEREGASSPGQGAYYTPQQMSMTLISLAVRAGAHVATESYLQDLRTNRPARPTGSRPPPAHFKTWSSRENSIPTFAALHAAAKENDGKDNATQFAAPTPQLHHRGTLNASLDQAVESAGKALVQLPRGRDAAASRERTPSLQYREDARRKAERRESSEVRAAMAQLDLQAEEKLYESARDEAAEIVWKHRNPNAPENSPHAPYAYPGPERKNLQRPKLQRTRSRSVGPDADGDDGQRGILKQRKRHSIGSQAGSQTGSRSSSAQEGPVVGEALGGASSAFDLKIAKASSDLPQQRKSSGSHRKPSGSLFQNPNDQIYEEPEEEAPPAPAPTPLAAEPPQPAPLPLGMRRNPFTRFQSIKGNAMARSNTDPIVSMRRFDRYEIHKNEPTQSRNAAYTLNTNTSKPAEPTADAENASQIKMKHGKEIRSDELRAATGFSLRDRSPKLPTPSMVSDAPGRPIVSFQKNYGVVELREEKSVFPADSVSEGGPPKALQKSATEPLVPTRKSVFERPSSRAGAAPSGFERPASRSGAASPAPLKEGGPSSSPAPLIPADPYALPDVSSKPVPADPYALPSSSRPQPPTPTSGHARSGSIPEIGGAPTVPAVSVSASPAISTSAPATAPARGRFNRVATTQAVPTIAVNEAPSLTRGHSFNAPVVSLPSEIPAISVNESPTPRALPTINAPSISVTPSVPSINVNDSPLTRPLPDPRTYARGPSAPSPTKPSPSRPLPSNARTHWTPTTVRTGAQCTQCALPIAGRIVSAAGCRFHPDCFACYQCGEKLECVAFYPEPAPKHAARCDRIRARAAGAQIPPLPGWESPDKINQLAQQDGEDESPRFYCHLDFHESFSPRCKSCTTPIEGEVVVACGATWHPGHFFCAQCGDPFQSDTPFVEKEGFAWCVGCHVNRFSARCRGCRKPVVDRVVKALGGEWHAECFCCVECHGPFADGRFFLRGEERPVCVACEERRLKA
ncbi:hypothetical protein EJ07DRAFT_98460 [Lizonia empirigonia]|nr:hypothetical protein EJ07DRAFT_98460 [Lizonia empirigonia]